MYEVTISLLQEEEIRLKNLMEECNIRLQDVQKSIEELKKLKRREETTCGF